MEKEMQDVEAQTSYKTTLQKEASNIFHKRNPPVTLKVLSVKLKRNRFPQDYYYIYFLFNLHPFFPHCLILIITCVIFNLTIFLILFPHSSMMLYIKSTRLKSGNYFIRKPGQKRE